VTAMRIMIMREYATSCWIPAGLHLLAESCLLFMYGTCNSLPTYYLFLCVTHD